MTGAGWAGLTDVHLLQLPVPLSARAREHFEGLMREFFLIASGDGQDGHLPARLTQVVDAIVAQFEGINTEADQRLEEAIEAHVEVIADHVLLVPPEAAPAARALEAVLDEADAYCQDGEHLLTLATPPDCLAYRRWYLAEVAGQLSGEPPVPWPDSAPARALSPGRPER